jgi:hypothetical protein
LASKLLSAWPAFRAPYRGSTIRLHIQCDSSCASTLEQLSYRLIEDGQIRSGRNPQFAEDMLAMLLFSLIVAFFAQRSSVRRVAGGAQ